LKQHGVISTGQARRLGIEPYRLSRSGSWSGIAQGVYRLAACPESWEQALMAAVLASGTGAVASHRAAAWLQGLDSVGKKIVEVSVPRPLNPVRRQGVVVHRVSQLERIDVASVKHIPVTSVTRTLIDLGAVADVDAVELALESALRSRTTSLALVRRRLSVLGGRGRPGTAALRKVLAGRLYETPTDSVLETRFVQLCRRYKLPPPTRQHGVGAATVDFAWEDRRVLVELEGFGHHGSAADHRRDMGRQNGVLIGRPGWLLLRYGWVDVVESAERVASELRAALAIR
jgi:very-short-patch-repair endonuclease